MSCLSDNQEDIYLLDFLVFQFNFFHSFFSLFFVRCVTCGFFWTIKLGSIQYVVSTFDFLRQ